jgi:hypothetical protein
MKKIFAPLILSLICVFAFTTGSAQNISKKSLVSDLDNSNGMTMDSKQKKQYDDINNRTANELMDVDKNQKSKNERDKDIDNIFDKRDNDVDKMFGNDKKYDDTRNSFHKNSKELRRKIKLGKLII